MYKSLFLPTQKIFLLDTFYMLLASLKGGVLNILLCNVRKNVFFHQMLFCNARIYFILILQNKKEVSLRFYRVNCLISYVNSREKCWFFFRKNKENFIKIKDKNLQQKYKLELCKNAVFLVYPNIYVHSKV